jgi:hypothetical protein
MTNGGDSMYQWHSTINEAAMCRCALWLFVKNFLCGKCTEEVVRPTTNRSWTLFRKLKKLKIVIQMCIDCENASTRSENQRNTREPVWWKISDQRDCVYSSSNKSVTDSPWKTLTWCPLYVLLFTSHHSFRFASQRSQGSKADAHTSAEFLWSWLVCIVV